MFYVYLLKDGNKKIYIGYSRDLRRRISEHKNQKVFTTKKMFNLKLVYYEAYSSEELAKEREHKLKQFGSAHHGLLKRLKIL
ncbi:MAG: GIY-YIG nuclease family protein [Candidatus Doudnabacteria bacterium]